MNKKAARKFTVVVLIALLISLSAPLWLRSNPSGLNARFSVSDGLERKFLDQYAMNADLNSGVTIQLLSLYNDEADSQAGIFF